MGKKVHIKSEKKQKPKSDVQGTKPSGNIRQQTKVIAKNCYIRIDIPGKTFSQIRNVVEKAVYPTRKFAYQYKITRVLQGKIRVLIPKRANISQEQKPIKTFIQNELNTFYKEFVKEKELKPEITFKIVNYREQEGSFKVLFDIIIIFLKKAGEAIIEVAAEELMTMFIKWIKSRLDELLKDKVDKKNIETGKKTT